MHKSLQNIRFSIKPQKVESNRPTELARTMSIHPLTYQELPYDPEYSHYAGRLTTEKLSNASPDEQYWKTKQEIILRHTGEHPYEISGPDALKLLQKIFPRDISKVKKGRCSYQFACYHDGGIITDGLLLRIEIIVIGLRKQMVTCYRGIKLIQKDLMLKLKSQMFM